MQAGSLDEHDAAKSGARIAKAKQAHDEVVTGVYHAQADALEIEALAKRRLADECDAAQERGEVRKAGNFNSSSPEELVSVSDIGLTQKDIHEARQIRDAERDDPGVTRRALDGLLERGEEPTRAAVQKRHSVRYAFVGGLGAMRYLLGGASPRGTSIPTGSFVESVENGASAPNAAKHGHRS